MEVLGANEIQDLTTEKLDSLFNILLIKGSSAYVTKDLAGRIGAIMNNDYIDQNKEN